MNDSAARFKKQYPVLALLRNPIDFLALGFGTGCVPVAPGTFGTVAGMLVFLPMRDLSLTSYILVVVTLFLLGVWFCRHAAAALGVHDHPAIVWDEVVGYLVTMTAAPPGWMYVIFGFVLFRLFDILKPWPVRWLDRHVHGGLGIMLDDVAAALMALACLHIIPYLL